MISERHRVHGASARAMFEVLIAGEPCARSGTARGRLRDSRDELFEALSTDQFSAAHLWNYTTSSDINKPIFLS